MSITFANIHRLTSCKTDIISYMAAHPEDFDEAIKLAISNKQPYSWRSLVIVEKSISKMLKELNFPVKTSVSTCYLSGLGICSSELNWDL